MKQDPIFILIIFLPAYLAAQSPSSINHNQSIRITSINNKTIVPLNWYHPIIEWDDSGTINDVYQVLIWADKIRLSIDVTGNRHVIQDDSFKPLLKNKTIYFKVTRRSGSSSISSDTVQVIVDPQPFNDKVIYRLVEPLFNPRQNAYIQSLSLEDGMPKIWGKAENTCIGCHAYSDNSAVLNLKKSKDRRIAIGKSLSTGDLFQQYRLGEFSFVSISPNGKKIAVVKNSKSLIEIKSRVSEPFDMTYSAGDIEIFNPADGSIEPLPGASDTNHVEDMPSWSPDGNTILFCRYDPNPGINSLKPVRLFQVPFNSGKGGKATPVLENPPSDYCYFPKYSPDGKFISFASGDASKGYFARKSSSIWLYSLESKSLKKLSLNMSGTMNSWHVWSSDGHWIVFSTKRTRDELTTLFLAKIDSNGTDHPSFEIAFDPKFKVNLPFLIPAEAKLDFGENLQEIVRTIFHF